MLPLWYNPTSCIGCFEEAYYHQTVQLILLTSSVKLDGCMRCCLKKMTVDSMAGQYLQGKTLMELLSSLQRDYNLCHEILLAVTETVECACSCEIL